MAESISKNLKGKHKIIIEQFDSTTNNAAIITSKNAPAEKGNYVQRALQFLQDVKPASGFSSSQSVEFKADPVVQTTSSNSKVVHLQQMYNGRPIFQAGQSVQFEPNGAISGTAGNTITIEEDITQDIPNLSVIDALRKAAEYLKDPDPALKNKKDQFGQSLNTTSLDLSKFNPKIVSTISDDPTMSTILETPPFVNKIKASLLWFDLPNEELRLAWEFVITLPQYQGQYRTIVDAQNGKILYNRELSRSLIARGKAYGKDGSTEQQLLTFPRQIYEESSFAYLENFYNLKDISKYSIFKDTFPNDWVVSDRSEGSNAKVHLATEENWNGNSAKGRIQD